MNMLELCSRIIATEMVRNSIVSRGVGGQGGLIVASLVSTSA